MLRIQLNKSDDKETKQNKKEKKRLKKELKKNKKRNRPQMVILGFIMFTVLITLFIYALALLVSPSHKIEATIKPVYNGFEFSYNICNIKLSDPELKVGDTIYVTDNGKINNTPKNSIKMEIVSINNGYAELKFAIQNVPQFLSAAEMKLHIKNSEPGRQYSSVYVVGKIVGNKFVLKQISPN